jgi:hypothetical protein
MDWVMEFGMKTEGKRRLQVLVNLYPSSQLTFSGCLVIPMDALVMQG